MAAHVVGHRAPGEIVAAADRAADQHLDGLAAIEVRHRLRVRHRRHGQDEKRADQRVAHDHDGLASEASSRPWPRIASVTPIVLNATKKQACV